MTALCVFVGAVLITSGCLAPLCLRRSPDGYPPEAAEAPDPVNEVGDEYQRAKWFTGTEAVPAPPVVVAGDDLLIAKLVGELQSAYLAYRRGEDVCVGAPAEPSPEVQR
jgi:hypothetical protein